MSRIVEEEQLVTHFNKLIPTTCFDNNPNYHKSGPNLYIILSLSCNGFMFLTRTVWTSNLLVFCDRDVENTAGGSELIL